MTGLAIIGGRLIDGHGGDPVDDSLVLVEGKKITRVGKKGDKIPQGYKEIDASGKTVMPGLIESHTHPLGERFDVPGRPNVWKYLDNVMNSPILSFFKAPQVLRLLLKRGVTMVRILHPTIPSAPELKGEYLVALRTAAERKYFPSPRLLAAGCVIPTGGHLQAMTAPFLLNPGWVGQDGPWEVRKRVRECMLYDVDWIKLLGPTGGGGVGRDGPKVQGMNLEEVQAACEEAHWKNVPVSAHAHGGPGLEAAIMGGIDTLEHGTWLYEQPNLIDVMKERGIIFVPTMGISFHESFSKYDSAKAGKLDPETNAKILDRADAIKKSFRAAKEAGVTIATGTDFMNWDINALVWEMHVYVEYGGMTPMEAIVATTKNAALACNVPETGTIEQGKLADIIVVDGDPTKDVNVLWTEENIKHVILNGELQIEDGVLNW